MSIKMPVVKSKVSVHTSIDTKLYARIKKIAVKHDLPKCDVINAILDAGVAGYESSMKKAKANARKSK